jgi:hypothetical protein
MKLIYKVNGMMHCKIQEAARQEVKNQRTLWKKQQTEKLIPPTHATIQLNPTQCTTKYEYNTNP